MQMPRSKPAWADPPVLATSPGLVISSGAMNSGVPQGSAGCWKNTARLKSITFTGASGALPECHTFQHGRARGLPRYLWV